MATSPAERMDRCRVCAGVPHRGFGLCFCCTAIADQLRLPLVRVVPMTEYRVGDRMHRLLRGYKDAPSPAARDARVSALAALVALWLEANEESLRCRLSGGWDLVTTVPSSCGRNGSPVDALVERVPVLADAHRRLLVRGDDRLGHLVAGRGGYLLAPGVDPAALSARSVLVFDDTLTTGARGQSAAAALRTSRVSVRGILVVGRAVGARSRRVRAPSPERSAGAARLG